MALNKLALSLIAGVASVGVIGGVTAAVVTSNSSAVMNLEDGKHGETETETGMGMGTDSEKNPDQNNPTINLKEIVSKFKAEDIVLSNGAMKNDTYAFNVKKEQLALSKQAMKNVPEGVEVVVESINNTSDGVELNQGKLSVTLKASLKDKAEEGAKISSLLVDGFKTPSQTLTSYLKPVTDDAKTNALNLTKPVDTDTSITFTSIEILNTISPAAKGPVARSSRIGLTEAPKIENEMTGTSGVTTLFRQINKPKTGESTEKTISVVGKVKLAKITKTKEQEEPVFHLVSAVEGTSLKLVQEKDEALINEILVTKLTVSNISLDLKGFDTEEQAKFLMKFRSEASTKMYTEVEGGGYSLTIKDMPEEEKVSVDINPVLVKRIQKQQMLTANLTVSYGSKEGEIKTYSTSKKEDAKELKSAGFSFSVYSKKLDGDHEVIQSMKITDNANKLDKFFTKESLAKGVKTMTLQESDGSSGMKPIGGFTLVSLKDIGLKADFSLGEVKTSMLMPKDRSGRQGGELDIQQEKWVSENWISFVGYSFGKDLENKILFIPKINLIHTAETQVKVTEGAESK